MDIEKINDIKPAEETTEEGHRWPIKDVVVMIVLFVAIIAIAIYATGLAQRYSFQKMEKTASTELEGGNYTAALVLYNKLKETNPENIDIASQVDRTRGFLFAEESYLKAFEAAEKEDWFSVEVLLNSSEFVFDQEFKFYNEALELYRQASQLVDSSEKEIANEISGLKQNIKSVEQAKSRVEREKSTVESQLQQTVSQKNQTEQALNSTKELLKTSQEQITQNQAQIEEEQRRARELELKAQQEQLAKFVNEVGVYVSMLKKSNTYLNSAIDEINKSNDVAAFSYIDNAEVLLSEVYEKAEDLRVNRTPVGFEGRVNEIKDSADLFIQASKDLKRATAFIGEADFNQYFNNGQDKKTQAFQTMRAVEDFVTNNS